MTDSTRAATLAALLLLAACGSDIDTTPEGGGGSGAGGSPNAGGSPDVGGSDVGGSGAGGAAPCPTERLVTGDGFACTASVDAPCDLCKALGCQADGDEPKIASEGPARCVLEALRDRTFGIVEVNLSPDAGGFCGERDTIYIAGETAWVVHDEYYDKGHDETGAGRALKPAAFYQACLDGPVEGLAACFADLFGEEASCPGECCSVEQ